MSGLLIMGDWGRERGRAFIVRSSFPALPQALKIRYASYDEKLADYKLNDSSRGKQNRCESVTAMFTGWSTIFEMLTRSGAFV